VLAPPYDVISDAQRDSLYARDLRNVVRIDFGVEYPDDIPGRNDRYTRAAHFLTSWLELGVLLREPVPAMYVHDHEFLLPEGVIRHRRGILAVVPAEPWERGDLLPHERTPRGPKEDRLALLRTIRVQTSPVFAVWSGASADTQLDGVTARPPLLGGRTDGEFGSEKHLLWVASPEQAQALAGALEPARLYVADGHHRYETAATYHRERAATEPHAPEDAPFRWCLVYLSDAADPTLTILPTHRLVRPAPGVAYSLDDLWSRLDDPWELEPAGSAAAAYARAAELRPQRHAFAATAHDGSAVLHRPRTAAVSPRAGLDVTVLESEVLGPAGVSADDIRSGALAYTRDVADLVTAVQRRDALLGFAVQPASMAEVIAVADAEEVMPQKSTYFYPKVPTGLALHPV
jgi:uncharacterized protein (DUF1015 family)